MIATMVGDGCDCVGRKDDEAGWGWPGRLGSATDVCGTTTKEPVSSLANGRRKANDDYAGIKR